MDEHTAPSAINTYQRSHIKGYEAFEELALNLRWSWNHSSDRLWELLDPALWDRTHNPWIVLQTVSREKLEEVLSDAHFREYLNDIVRTHRVENQTPKWFQRTYSTPPVSCIAYFSMEFMLAEALPIYSGGLGNVAGDQLKAASDLGLPVFAVGLLYQRGYFRQIIDKNGSQQALYPFNDPMQLPITPVRKENGEWLRIEVALPGWSLWLRTWQVQVGTVKLYLLDSNDSANFPAYRGITSELYGGGSELRLQQEMLLGIAGWRLLETLGLKPDVCHLNEGHAAFAVLERAKGYMQETGLSFAEALAVTRAGNLFTTHTAVPAGFDRFSPALMEQYLGNYVQHSLKISFHELLALGRQNPDDDKEYFNMAYLAMRGSGAVNGVSHLHSKVSQHIFSPLFPRWPLVETPVSYVTNGVHMPSWDSITSDELWTEACGKDRWLDTTECLEEGIRTLSDAKIWHMRNDGRKKLVEFTQKRLSWQLAALSSPKEEIEYAKSLFDPHTLTLGFARRFATYKRPNMLLKDPERLLRILSNRERPVQLIIAGKAHPADAPGQALIHQWMQFIKRPDVRPYIIFLSDYDMNLTEKLVQGVDVWINTPRRPWEACGTSGMKVLVNGGLNLSELDGWWADAYTPEVGWALGDGKEHGDNKAWDDFEADTLYDLLEHQIIPEYYCRDSEGLPTRWIQRIRDSMAQLTPHFSANRAVRQYTEEYYIPAAAKYRERTKNKGAFGAQMVDWHNQLQKKWPVIRFSESKMQTVGQEYHFEVQVYLDSLNPDWVKVELFADKLETGSPVRWEMVRARQLPSDSCTYAYQATVPATRPASHYTVRVIPYFSGISVPLEENHILWQT